MKTIVKFLLALVVLVVILALVSFLLPSEVTVTRDVTINAPVENAFEQVNDLKKWGDWSYRHTLDENMEVSYSGSEKGQGASYSWSGNKDVGVGTLTIAESIPNKRIKTDLDFGPQGTGEGSWEFSAEADATKVTWSFFTELGMNPMMRWMGLMFDSMLGEAMESGLAGLKKAAESSPVKAEFSTTELKIEELEPVAIYSILDSTPLAEMGAKMGEILPEVAGYVYGSGAEVLGMPLSIYHAYGDDMVVLECGIPVAEATAGEGRVKPSSLPGGRAVTAIHHGAYMNLDKSYGTIEEYIASNGLEKNGAPWEVYMNDPGEVADERDYLTKIHFPIK